MSSEVADSKIRSEIAANVRAELARAGLRQNDVARVFGTSRNAVSLKLLAKVSFRGEELVAIASLLDVPISSLFPAPNRERVAA